MSPRAHAGTIIYMADKEKSPQKPGLLAALTGKGKLAADKARLEAFMAAFPGAWCGWAADGTLGYNEAFCGLLKLDAIGALSDIQHALSPSDAAVLEGQFAALQDQGKAFNVTVASADGARIFKLSGTRGKDAAGEARFDVLWLEDITALKKEQRTFEAAKEHAEEERDRLQSALDRVPHPLWLRDSKTQIIWCNRAYAAALDASPATVIAEQRELPVKAAAKKTAGRTPGKALAQAALDANGAESSQAHVIISGRRRLLNFTEIALGPSAMTLGIAHDVTREEELETTHERYMTANKELLEQLGTAIGIYNSEQKLEFYNSAFAQLWKMEDKYLNTRPKLGDLMEKLREQRLLPEQADFRKYKQVWLNMFTGLLAPHEDMLYLPGGQALRMLVVPNPMGGIMMTFEDVTSRLELESSYNTLIAVQKETLDNLNEGVAVFGGDGRLRLWNPAFARLWALNPEDLDGNPHITRLAEKMKSYFRPEQWPKAQKALVTQSLDRSLQGGRLEREDGSLVTWSTVPLPDGGMLVTHVDVTDTVRVETALRDKNAALEAAERLKLDFLANVSYQLRTPLSAIMGFTEILNNEYFGKLNERQREYTTGMQEAGERLLSLIDDILDLSTIEAGYMFLNKEEIDIQTVLESISNLTRDWARKDKLDVRLDIPADIGNVLADERRLKQALLNLVSNAINFSPPGGAIILSARRDDASVMLAVADQGPGVAPEDQKRIFMPFERAAKADRKTATGATGRGAGLGLALVKNIAELHGGRILLESRPGQGATFTVVLPLNEPVQQKQATNLRIVK